MKHATATLEGDVLGKLRVVERAGSTAEGRRLWRCLCECGAEVLATTKSLTIGKTKSCPMCAPKTSRSPLAVRLSNWVASPTGCWEWQGKRNYFGYGCITVNGRDTRAHREMFFMVNPQSNRSLVVMHACDNPPCVNPAHLSLGTVGDNVRDMVRKGRAKGGAKPGNKNGAGNKGRMRAVQSRALVTSKLGDEVDL